jgi:hypothetical protein
MIRRVSSVATLALGVAIANGARAEDGSRAALTAFEEGRTLEQTGDYAGALIRFEESERLLPSVGSELNLGTCLEHEGRLASAAREYSQGADRADALGEAKRAMGARKRAAELAGRASSLEIELPDGLSPRGVELFVDEVPADPAASSTRQPVDGGVHRLRFVVPGREPWSKEVKVAPVGEHVKVIVSSFDAPMTMEPRVTAPEAEAPKGPPAPLAAAAPTLMTADKWSVRRFAGMVAASVGVAGLALGAYSGTQAISQWSQRQAACPRNVCSPGGNTLGDDAGRSATVATIGFVAGAIAIASGIALFLLKPIGTRASVRVGAAPARNGPSVLATGTF